MMTEELAEKITEELLKHFGLTDWFLTFRNYFTEFDDEIDRLIADEPSENKGCCIHNLQQISLVRAHVVNDPDFDVLDTITHEIAHALLGEGHGHDETFKQKHAEVHRRAMKHLVEIAKQKQKLITVLGVRSVKAANVRRTEKRVWEVRSGMHVENLLYAMREMKDADFKYVGCSDTQRQVRYTYRNGEAVRHITLLKNAKFGK
jgi:hypothetical protein